MRVLPSFLVVLGLSLASSSIANTVNDWNADIDAFLQVLLAEHDDPYFFTPKNRFDAAVQDYRNQLPHLDRSQRIAGLARVVAMVGDGHTWVPMHRLPFDGLPPGPGFRSLPIRFDWFEDGLYVVGTTSEYRDLLGKRVQAIGGTSADEAISRVLGLLPQDAVNLSAEFVGEWLMQAELLYALDLSTNPDRVSITVGEQLHEVVPLGVDELYDWVFSMDGGPRGKAWHTAAQAVPLWRQPLPGPWRHKILGDAVYFQFQEIRDDADATLREAALAAVRNAESLPRPSLVIDLRRCLGGNGQLNAGFVDALGSSDLLRGRVAVMTGRQTHSAAVMLVSALEAQGYARFYGQATADRPNHHGETNIFITPHSTLPIIYASQYYQTSHVNDERRFREPDVRIPYLFVDYKAGRDPVLDRALADLRENSL